MKRLMGILILSVYSLLTLFPQELWTGSALGGSANDFPSGGLTAASNSFPIGSQVDVTNPSTGQTVRVTIQSRVNEPGILLLLSNEAANQLGVDRRFPTVIQAQPAPSAPTPRFSSIDDPFSADPDINPAASLGDPNAFLFDRSPIPELAFPEPQPPFEPIGPSIPAQQTPLSQQPEQPSQTQVPSQAVSPRPTIGTNGTNGTALDLPLEQTQILATEPQPAQAPLAEQPTAPQPTAPVPQPTAPQQGISSALQNFRSPGAGSGQSLLSQRLAEQEAAQQAAQQTQEILPTQDPQPLQQQPAQDLQPIEEQPAQIAQDTRILRDPEPKPDAKPESEIQPVTQVPANGSENQEETPTTSPRFAPESPQAPMAIAPRTPDLPTITPEPLEPLPSVVPSSITAIPDPEFATPLLTDPLSDHLSEYRADFGEPPLVRTTAGGPMEPTIPRITAPQTAPPRVGQTPPNLELAQAEADSLRIQAPGAVGPVADMPVPSFVPDRPEVAQPRLNPTIVTQPRATLPTTRIPEAESFEDLIARPEPGAPGAIHPSAQALPLLRAPELTIASDDLNRVPSPRGVSAGIAVPAPQIRGQDPGDPGIPRVSTQATLPSADLREPESPLTQAEPGIPLIDQPRQPEFLITLVPAEFRTAGSPTETPIEVPSPADQDPRAPLALAGDPPRPDLFTQPSPADQDPRAPLALAGDPPRPDLFSQPSLPLEGQISAQLNVPADPSIARVEVFPDPAAPETLPEDTRLTIAQDPPVPEALTQPVVPSDQDPQARLAIPDPQPSELVQLQEPVQDSADDLMVFLEPAEPQAPTERVPQTFVPITPEPAPIVVQPVEPVQPPRPTITSQVVERLDRESFYVQIGAFSNPDIARQALSQINPGYPITITQVPGTERPLFRLFVGPLTEDEKGTALFWFRARGYRDAFIRSGAETL